MDRKKGTKKPKRALKKIAKPIKPIQPKKNNNSWLLFLIGLGSEFMSKFMDLYLFNMIA
jgi:hypothetical protein